MANDDLISEGSFKILDIKAYMKFLLINVNTPYRVQISKIGENMRSDITACFSIHLQEYWRDMDIGGSSLSQVRDGGVSSANI